VIGGAGFIGSAICELLLTQNYSVKCLDNLSSGSLDNISNLLQNKNFEFNQVDILNFDALKNALKDCEVINHQAALTSVIQSNIQPNETFTINVNGFLNVMECARLLQIKKVVYASSSAVYGDTAIFPIEEQQTLHPLSMYGLSKKLNEELAAYYAVNYNISTIGLRYFNVFGPKQNVKSDYAAVIPLFIEKCRSKQSITIYGDGTQTRDFIFVKDVALANIKAIESPITRSEVFNIGSGVSTSILDLALTIQSLFDCEVPIQFLDKRAGEIPHSLASTIKAHHQLSFHIHYQMNDALHFICNDFKNE
jgi:nucleoside-diphosphate-sugar epimerase